MDGSMADAPARIAQLRKWLDAQKIDAYLVPHSDRFQSEMLPALDERLAWLTGFTGSNGMAAVLKNKAVLFTDGRYTISAPLQMDMNVYEIFEAPPKNPSEWLVKELPAEGVIGFDPMLFTVAQISQWQKTAAKNKWELQAIEENPIDLFWKDRPVEAILAAEIHKSEFAGETTESKIAKILEKKSDEAHHLLISDPSLVCWLLNMRGKDVMHTPLVQSVVLLDKDGQVTLFTEPKKITPALHASWGNHVAVEDLSQLFDIILKINKPIQIDPTLADYAVKDFCIEHGIKVIEAADPSVALRANKNAVEIAGAIKAHEIDAQAVTEFRKWLKSRDFKKEKITELDVVQKLHEARVNTGQCVDDSFDTIAGFGPNGAIIHYRATKETNLQLHEGSLLLLDSGGQYHYGTTDVTRVFAIGTPTAKMKTHYTAVLKGLIALSSTRFPVGISGGHLDGLARAPIWEQGLDYAHGTGHGVGSYLSVHEWPRGAYNINTLAPFSPGMILSIEPGIYLKDEYGIRLENLVVVVEDKRAGDVKDMLAFKTLTKIPFEDDLIDRSMLNAQEIEFLKQF
jgi:Xaa-Pro aminopeptidase